MTATIIVLQRPEPQFEMVWTCCPSRREDRRRPGTNYYPDEGLRMRQKVDLEARGRDGDPKGGLLPTIFAYTQTEANRRCDSGTQ